MGSLALHTGGVNCEPQKGYETQNNCEGVYLGLILIELLRLNIGEYIFYLALHRL